MWHIWLGWKGREGKAGLEGKGREGKGSACVWGEENPWTQGPYRLLVGWQGLRRGAASMRTGNEHRGHAHTCDAEQHAHANWDVVGGGSSPTHRCSHCITHVVGSAVMQPHGTEMGMHACGHARPCMLVVRAHPCCGLCYNEGLQCLVAAFLQASEPAHTGMETPAWKWGCMLVPMRACG